MKRVIILVEGQTEETFIQEILRPHLWGFDVDLTPTILRTSPGHKGGISSYAKVKRELRRVFTDRNAVLFTTFLDLYGLPSDVPGHGSSLSGAALADHIEASIRGDIGQDNFRPYVQLHEFEALLFSQPSAFELFFSPREILRLQVIRNAYQTPEDINNSPHTAPSKRILGIYDAYEKVFQGILIAKIIGLERMRADCPRFSAWLSELERLA